jgi:hypothetical protein
VIDESRVKEFAEIVRRLKYRPISFDNPELFPEMDDCIYPNYVFFMVAIDHRTGFDVDFKYRGSDLLFYLARKKQKEDSEFFTAKNLVNVTAEDLKKIFCFRGRTVWDVEERALLLRDCAEKLLHDYDGDFVNLLKKSEFEVNRIVERLRFFRAYEDPLMKKSFLLLKILKRGGYGIKGDLIIPVDSVLVRVAISSGILKVDEEIQRKIDNNVMLNEDETERLRRETLEAFMKVANLADTDPDILDDILWNYGRVIDSKLPTPLDVRVDREALRDFLSFITIRKIEKIVFPPNWYF